MTSAQGTERDPSRAFTVRDFGEVTAFALAYALLSWVSFRLFRVESLEFATFWPPVGFSLAVMLRAERRRWPALALAVFVVDIVTHPDTPLGVSLIYSSADALEPLLGAALLRAYAGRAVTLKSVRDVLSLLALGAIVSPALAGLLGTLGSTFLHPSSLLATWIHWSLGDCLGVILIAPLVLGWDRRWWRNRRRVIEAATILVLLGAASYTALHRTSLPAPALILLYATLPLILWAALRVGHFGVALATAVVATVGTWQAATVQGPFATIASSPETEVLATQAFLAVVSLSGMLLAASIHERQRAERGQRLLAEAGLILAEPLEDGVFQRFAERVAVELGVGAAVIAQRAEGTLEIEGAASEDPERLTRLRETLPGTTLPMEPRACSDELWLPIGDGHGALVVMTSAGGQLDHVDRNLADDLARRGGQALAIRRAIRIRDEFIDVASHELRTPLQRLMLRIDLVDRAARAGQPPRPDAIEGLARDVAALVAMIENMLDARNIGARGVEIERKRTDLVALARGAVETFVASAKRTVELDMPEDPLWGTVNPKLIEQVLANLLDNASRFSPREGSIGVTLRQGDGEAVLSVSDHGIGIPSGDQAHVFERFFRASNVPVTSYAGLGLGLLIARDIVVRHGGRLWVDSAVGEGSTFSVALPCE